jgi:hypothetical protein
VVVVVVVKHAVGTVVGLEVLVDGSGGAEELLEDVNDEEGREEAEVVVEA